MSNTIGTEFDPHVDSLSAEGQSNTSGTPLKEKATQKVHAAGTAVKETTHQVATKAREMTREAAEELKTQSKEFAHTRKDQLGQRIKGGGQAIRRAAEKLRSEDDPNLGHYAQIVAERVEQAGNYIQSKDVREIRRDLENAARRRPELVFGGMFVAGLAIARFLKASTPGDHDRADHSDDDTGYSRPMETDGGSETDPMDTVAKSTLQTPYTPTTGTP